MTVTLTAPDARWNQLAFRNRGDMKGALADLAEDFVFNETTLIVTLSGLQPGEYAVTTWHHDRDYDVD